MEAAEAERGGGGTGGWVMVDDFPGWGQGFWQVKPFWAREVSGTLLYFYPFMGLTLSWDPLI